MRAQTRVLVGMRSLSFRLVATLLIALVAAVAAGRAFAQVQPAPLPACSGQAIDPNGNCSAPKACGQGGICNSWVLPLTMDRCTRTGAVAGDNCIAATTQWVICGLRGTCSLDKNNECVDNMDDVDVTTNPVGDGGPCSIPAPPNPQ